MDQDCPNCLCEVNCEGKEEEGSKIICKSCSLELRMLHGKLIDGTEYVLETAYH